MMDWYSKAFLRAALVWFGLGLILGLCMAIWPALVVYRPAHAHFNLLGFMAMFLFGVAYHVIPRFMGQPIRTPRLATAHWYIQNVGLGLMVAGFFVRPSVAAFGQACLAIGGTLSFAGGWIFIVIIWRTLSAQSGPAGLGRRVPVPMAREEH